MTNANHILLSLHCGSCYINWSFIDTAAIQTRQMKQLQPIKMNYTIDKQIQTLLFTKFVPIREFKFTAKNHCHDVHLDLPLEIQQTTPNSSVTNICQTCTNTIHIYKLESNTFPIKKITREHTPPISISKRTRTTISLNSHTLYAHNNDHLKFIR